MEKPVKKRKVKKEDDVVEDESIEKIVDDVVEEIIVKITAEEIPCRTSSDISLSSSSSDITIDSPKKEISKDNDDPTMDDIFGKSGEILPGVADYLVCGENTDDDEVGVDFEYEGVIYIRLPLDDLIMDINVGCQMGYIQEDGSVKFFPGKLKMHEKNRVNYQIPN